MDIEPTAEDAVMITKGTATAPVMLARDTLARALGLTGAEAERALARGSALLPARRQVDPVSLLLLDLLGVRTQFMGARGAAQVDLSVRRSGPFSARQAEALCNVCPEARPGALEGPEGLVLADLPQPAAHRARAQLEAGGFQVTATLHAAALFDLFLPQGEAAPEGLAAYLALIGQGLQRPGLGGALAEGLERRLVQRLLPRFPGVVALHQAFLRYDLQVTGPGRLALREAADLLGPRGLVDPVAALRLARPVVIERALPRPAARQFLTDYAQIGLPVRAVLCGLAVQNG